MKVPAKVEQVVSAGYIPCDYRPDGWLWIFPTHAAIDVEDRVASWNVQLPRFLTRSLCVRRLFLGGCLLLDRLCLFFFARVPRCIAPRPLLGTFRGCEVVRGV